MIRITSTRDQLRYSNSRLGFRTIPTAKEAIQAQKASVNIVTGATLTSEAFIQSMQSAKEILHGLGIKDSQIKIDYFAGL